jgi:uncharacterized OsmC-like protein
MSLRETTADRESGVTAFWESRSGELVLRWQTPTGDVWDEPYGQERCEQSPFELVAAALATSTVQALSRFAAQEQVAFDSLAVGVTHTLAEGILRLTRTIQIAGELTGYQVASVLEAADGCTLSRALAGRIEIVTLGLHTGSSPR